MTRMIKEVKKKRERRVPASDEGQFAAKRKSRDEGN